MEGRGGERPILQGPLRWVGLGFPGGRWEPREGSEQGRGVNVQQDPSGGGEDAQRGEVGSRGGEAGQILETVGR